MIAWVLRFIEEFRCLHNESEWQISEAGMSKIRVCKKCGALLEKI